MQCNIRDQNAIDHNTISYTTQYITIQYNTILYSSVTYGCSVEEVVCSCFEVFLFRPPCCRKRVLVVLAGGGVGVGGEVRGVGCGQYVWGVVSVVG